MSTKPCAGVSLSRWRAMRSTPKVPLPPCGGGWPAGRERGALELCDVPRSGPLSPTPLPRGERGFSYFTSSTLALRNRSIVGCLRRFAQQLVQPVANAGVMETGDVEPEVAGDSHRLGAD